MERESRHWKSKVSKRNLDSGKEKRLLITPIFMIEGPPSKSALFVNGTIGGYIPRTYEIVYMFPHMTISLKIANTSILSTLPMLSV